MRKSIALLCLVLGLCSSLRAQESRSPLDVLSYNLLLDFDMTVASISGEQYITFSVPGDSLATAQFDARELRIASVSENGRPCRFSYDGNKLAILPDTAYRKNSLHTVRILYTATPSKGMKLVRDSAESRRGLPGQIYTLYHTANWMPCNFHPGDKAQFFAALRLPGSCMVTGNGDSVEKVPLVSPGKADDYERQYNTHFMLRQSRDIPVYAMGFAAGNFREWRKDFGGTEFRAFYKGRPEAGIEKAMAGIAAVKKFFEEVSGTAYPGKRYSYVFVRGNAAQEASGFCLLGENYPDEILKEPMENWLLIHELSHEWWGNAITCSGWENFWLNEGLAQFMTAAAKERIFGREEYNREIWLSMRRYRRFREAGKDRALEFRTPLPEDSAGGGLVYNKGCLVLYILRNMLGEGKFWKGIRLYSQENFGKNVSGEDLRRAMEKAGGRDLRAFFGDYVYDDRALPLPERKSYPPGELLKRIAAGKDLFERIDAMEQLRDMLKSGGEKELKAKFGKVLEKRAGKDPSRLVRQIAGDMLGTLAQ